MKKPLYKRKFEVEGTNKNGESTFAGKNALFSEGAEKKMRR